jgi:hypothetical protein
MEVGDSLIPRIRRVIRAIRRSVLRLRIRRVFAQRGGDIRRAGQGSQDPAPEALGFMMRGLAGGLCLFLLKCPARRMPPPAGCGIWYQKDCRPHTEAGSFPALNEGWKIHNTRRLTPISPGLPAYQESRTPTHHSGQFAIPWSNPPAHEHNPLFPHTQFPGCYTRRHNWDPAGSPGYSPRLRGHYSLFRYTQFPGGPRERLLPGKRNPLFVATARHRRDSRLSGGDCAQGNNHL